MLLVALVTTAGCSCNDEVASLDERTQLLIGQWVAAVDGGGVVGDKAYDKSYIVLEFGAGGKGAYSQYYLVDAEDALCNDVSKSYYYKMISGKIIIMTADDSVVGKDTYYENGAIFGNFDFKLLTFHRATTAEQGQIAAWRAKP